MRDIIKTQRLTLRPLTLSDAQNLSQYGSDFEIARMTGSFPHPFPLLSAEFKIMDLISKQRRTLAYPYAITIDGGPLMGVVDLFRNRLDTDVKTSLELGYWIARLFWGKGFATEACQGLISEAEDTLGVRELKAGVFSDNPASLNVLKKLGFKQNTPKKDYPATEMFFSMARLEKTLSLNLTLDMADFNTHIFVSKRSAALEGNRVNIPNVSVRT